MPEFTPEEEKRLRARIERLCRGEDPEPVLRRYRVSLEEFRHWLTHPDFRRRLRALRRELSARRDLEICRGAHRAARQMSRAAMSLLEGFTDVQRKVCVDLIRLSRESPRRARRSSQPLASPDVPPDEVQRLIEELE